MGDQVERALEETVPLLRQVRKLKLLSEQELREHVRLRRDHEYAVSSSRANRETFLRYAAFERAAAAKLGRRASERGLPEKRARALSARAGARVNLVYSRAIRRFKGDEALYLHYARHCVRTGARKAAQKVFARAIAHRGDSEKVWLAAAAFHFDCCGDIKTARAISQRGIRALKGSKTLWKGYFQLELAYLAKLRARRATIGMAASSRATDQTRAAEVETAESLSGASPRNESERAGLRESGEPSPACVIPQHLSSCGKLSFWDGGVPFAVFRSAVGAASLNSCDAAGYWLVAVSFKFAPSLLLRSLAEELAARFGHRACPCLEIIGCRHEFDFTYTKYCLTATEVLVQSIGASGSESGKGSVVGERVVPSEVIKASESAVGKVVEILNSIRSDPHRSFCLAIVSELRDKLRPFASEGTCSTLVSRLERLLSSFSEEPGVSDQADAQGGSLSLERLNTCSTASEWTEYLKTTGSKAFEDCDQDALASIRTKLKATCAVCFRSREQERITMAWFAWERDIPELRKAYGMILQLPPASLRIFQSAISREIALGKLAPGHLRLASSSETVSIVRGLFEKASRLNGASDDVEFWVQYLNFERDVVIDVPRSSHVHWRASRTLRSDLLVAFSERITLINSV